VVVGLGKALARGEPIGLDEKPNTAICDVVFLLGYSDQSAFNHAFKRWTGLAPRAFLHS